MYMLVYIWRVKYMYELKGCKPDGVLRSQRVLPMNTLIDSRRTGRLVKGTLDQNLRDEWSQTKA